MLSPSPACLSLIKTFEGVRLKAYPDPATGGDPWTIGVGHTGPEVKRGLVWTMAQVDAALTADLAKFSRVLNAMIASAKAPTSQHQFDAMISLMFNVGQGNFAKSSIWKNHAIRRYANAAGAFALWNKANGKVMAGLTRRRAAEVELYRSA